VSIFDPHDKSRDPNLIPQAPVVKKGWRWDILFSHSPSPLTLHILEDDTLVEEEDRVLIHYKETGTETVIYLKHVATIMRTPFTKEVKDSKKDRPPDPRLHFKGDIRRREDEGQ
jgi:hypothetical protein